MLDVVILQECSHLQKPELREAESLSNQIMSTQLFCNAASNWQHDALEVSTISCVRDDIIIMTKSSDNLMHTHATEGCNS